jgi:hypothetical protein
MSSPPKIEALQMRLLNKMKVFPEIISTLSIEFGNLLISYP